LQPTARLSTPKGRKTESAWLAAEQGKFANYTNACLYLVSVHQMAPPQNDVADTAAYYSTHLSTTKGRKAESVWLTVGQGKFAGQRPMFYHCATQPTRYNVLRPSQHIICMSELLPTRKRSS